MLSPPNDAMIFAGCWTHEPHSLNDVSPDASAPVPFGSHTSTYVHRHDLLSFEMSMKTVEMCALINGTTPQEAYLQFLAEEYEEEMHGHHFRTADENECNAEDESSRVCSPMARVHFELDCDNEETEDMFIFEL